MTEKRFVEPHKDCRVIKNTQTGEIATYYDKKDGLMFLKWLNNLSDENEQLKKILNQAVKQMEVEMDKNSTRYYVGLLLDVKMYKKIKEILNDYKTI